MIFLWSKVKHKRVTFLIFDERYIFNSYYNLNIILFTPPFKQQILPTIPMSVLSTVEYWSDLERSRPRVRNWNISEPSLSSGEDFRLNDCSIGRVCLHSPHGYLMVLMCTPKVLLIILWRFIMRNQKTFSLFGILECCVSFRAKRVLTLFSHFADSVMVGKW